MPSHGFGRLGRPHYRQLAGNRSGFEGSESRRTKRSEEYWKNMRILGIGAVAVFVLGSAYWFLFHPPSSRARVASVAVPGDEHETLPSTPKATESPVAPAAASVAKPPSKTAVLVAHATTAPEAPYEALFDGDRAPVADSWRYRAAVSDILDRAKPLGGTVQNLECHFRVCKLQLGFSSRLADLNVFHDIFLRETTTDLPNGIGAFVVPVRRNLPDGTETATVYLAREGELTVANEENDPGG